MYTVLQEMRTQTQMVWRHVEPWLWRNFTEVVELQHYECAAENLDLLNWNTAHVSLTEKVSLHQGRWGGQTFGK